MSRDYYQDLQINRDATSEEIAKAYRKLALRWHPKLNKDDVKTQEHYFALISEAYEVLSDPVRKSYFDKFGEEKLKEGMFTQGQLKGGYRFKNNAIEIFNNFYSKNNAFAEIIDANGDQEAGSLFGSQFGGQNYKANQKPDDKHVLVEFTLEEAYSGCSKDVEYYHTVLKNDKRTTQNQKSNKILEITKGIQTNSFIKLEGKGNEAPYKKNSDLYFNLVEKKHPVFKRKGNNLIYVQKINLVDAFNSTPVELRTLDGRNLSIAMDTLINPKTIKVVKGEGMPILGQNGQRGDLLIKFDIIFPTQISQEQQKRIAELLE